MSKGLPQFNIYSVDELPRNHKWNSPRTGVINAGERATGGTHWVAYSYYPSDKYVKYFDPFGVSPDPRVEKYLKSSGKPLLVNTTQIQDLQSQSCGYHVMNWLHKGRRDMSHYLSRFDASDQLYNEKKLLRDINLML